MILELMQEARERGARLSKACAVLGLHPRTIQRWKRGPLEDQRRGPKRWPVNALTDSERTEVLNTINSPEYRDLSPSQIVPRLAEVGTYLASESTMYRILREEKQLAHRERTRPRTSRRPDPKLAHGPGEVWTWDITYLRSTIRGSFFYLYLILDIWSRKIVGWSVHNRELSDHAAALITRACLAEGISPSDLLVLHADNGGPMKGSTMLSTLQRLGVVPSFSRPHVSDDNPYSESLFRTLKYRPEYPERHFDSVDQARDWVEGFVRWYNHEHRHSSIRFVTPVQRHTGEEKEILERRRQTYQAAHERHPERWSGSCRNWSAIDTVVLNPAFTGNVEWDKEGAA